MQSANAAAPRIMDALLVLGQASPQHIQFAMLGLPQDIRTAALETAERARPVARRLASRKIACALRIEMAALRAWSKFPEILTSPAQWDSPADILGGEIVPLLIEASALQRSTWRRGSPRRDVLPAIWCAEKAGAVSWPTRQYAHYAFAAVLSAVSKAWALGVAAWLRDECAVWLCEPVDSTVRHIARLSPNLLELQCHSRIAGEVAAGDYLLPITNNAIAALPLACPRLQRLCLRLADGVSASALAHLLDKCAELCELDLMGCFIDDMRQLAEAVGARPHCVLTLAACDAAAERDSETPRIALLDAGHVQIRCVTCFSHNSGDVSAYAPTSPVWTCEVCLEKPCPDRPRQSYGERQRFMAEHARWPLSTYGRAAWQT
jgi:hypothetical protein